MKRYKNLFKLICTLDNIELADKKASKGKSSTYGVLKHNLNSRKENLELLELLKNGTYKTSLYKIFIIHEPKERIIYLLPYYPDRIVHHAIMNILEPIWKSIFIKNTYSSIKDRGIHACAKDVKKALEDIYGTKYCLKLDIRKFYPSIKHEILKQIIRHKIADKALLNVLDEIIDSAPGVPIGNYLSLYFANLYLAYFDHWVKEELCIWHYFRYADDIVLLHNDKNYLHLVIVRIKEYLSNKLLLEVKNNWQIFPVDSRGIDFVGYKFYHTHTLLRKDIKKNAMRVLAEYLSHKISLSQFYNKFKAYYGWLKYCNSKNILNKIQQVTGLHYSNFIGKLIPIRKVFNKDTICIVEINLHSKYYLINCIYLGMPCLIKSKNKFLLENILKETSKDDLLKWGISNIDTSISK